MAPVIEPARHARRVAGRVIVLSLIVAAATACAEDGEALDRTPFAGEQILVAEGIAFRPPDMTVPAGVPFTVGLENRDDGVPHALELVQGHGVGRPPLARIDPIVGRATARLDVPPLAPGPYVFACSVHPNMIVAVKAEG